MLSVIIPAYNHEKYIDECLHAVFNIDISGIEIIIIDDGSTDRTAEIIEKVKNAGENDHVKFIRKENSGLVDSLNIGLGLVKNKYIYIVASDDIPVPEGVCSCIWELEKTGSAAFCIGGARNLFKDLGRSTPVYKEEHSKFFDTNFAVNEHALFIDFPSPVLIQSTIFKAEALREIGGWDPSLKLDDYPLFIKILKRYPVKGKDYLFLPEIMTVNYRHHDANSYGSVFGQFEKVKQTIEVLAPVTIKEKAVAKKSAYYCLMSIRRRRIKDFFAIIKSIPNYAKSLVPIYLLYFVKNRFLK